MSLERQVEEFAAKITRTVRAVVGKECPEFKGDLLDAKEKFVVSQAQDAGIPLKIQGVTQFLITASYACTLDHESRFLRVFDSRITFFYSPSGKGRSPLFRYDFLRPKSSDVPAAHLHIHDSGSFLGDGSLSPMAAALMLGGAATKRGRRTQRGIAKGKNPTHQDLHYPLGGERFRPCLEDFLEGMIHEFGIDAEDGWEEALASGRETWRRSQTAAVVRDSPESAAEMLRELGYKVCPPESGPRPDNIERLRAF